MGSDPKDRLHDEISYYAALQPSEPGGPVRAGNSDFPAAVDKWPDHGDGLDEKDFTKYMHDAYCAVIALQRTLKALLDAGVGGATVYEFEYLGPNPNTANYLIDLPIPDLPRTVPGTSRVVVRGHEILSAQYAEVVVNDHIVQIKIIPAGLLEAADAVRIHYTMAVQL